MYKLANFMAILASTIFGYCCLVRNEFFRFTDVNWLIVTILTITVIFVHLLKSLRLYLEFHGTNLAPKAFFLQYCKSVPVSVLLPFKIGDLFKAYCFGYEVKSFITSVAVVLMDRFVDTLALLSVAVFISIVFGFHFNLIYVALITFLILLLCFYYFWPNFYVHWNTYFLKLNTTKRRLRILSVLKIINQSYLKIESRIKGKFTIVYVLSVFAWAIEILGLYLVAKVLYQGDISQSHTLSNYLMGVFSGDFTELTSMLIGYSAMILWTVFLVLKTFTICRWKTCQRFL